MASYALQRHLGWRTQSRLGQYKLRKAGVEGEKLHWILQFNLPTPDNGYPRYFPLSELSFGVHEMVRAGPGVIDTNTLNTHSLFLLYVYNMDTFSNYEIIHPSTCFVITKTVPNQIPNPMATSVEHFMS